MTIMQAERARYWYAKGYPLALIAQVLECTLMSVGLALSRRGS